MNRKQRRADAKYGAPQTTALPSPEQLLYGAALQHYQARRFAQAQPLLLQLIAANPRDHDALNMLGAIAFQTLQLDTAEELFRRAMAVRPNEATAHSNLGNLLLHQKKLEEAVVSLRRATRLTSTIPQPLNTLGTTLRTLNRLDEAIAAYRKAIPLDPNCPETHYFLAESLLMKGDFAEGWSEYEWRWGTGQMIADRLDVAQPQWRGEAAPGKTLLIHAEQGYGDSLQFCRYAPMAAEAGLRVILAAPAPLIRLLRSLPGIDSFVASGETVTDFDLHCPMLSLPLAFKTTLQTIPGTTPYLHADREQQDSWQSRLAALPPGKRIGLAWAGNPIKRNTPLAIDPRRSITLDQLAPLFDLPGLQFFSLQKDIAEPPAQFPLHNFMPEIQDFADTAALIANLDLVISVDTSTAHLASALNKPVWMLDRADPCWRWLAGRLDSPWYPSMRIFRQKELGNWSTVINEVVAALQQQK